MPGFELIDDQEKNAVAQIFEEGGVLFAHGFDSLRKKYHVRDFESQCSTYFRSPYTLALSSGTAALKCALKALHVGIGDEVITQGFNFIATVEAIIDCGAKPVICSIDSDLHLDIENCLTKVTNKTKAIVVVNMLGMTGPIDALRAALNSRNLNIPIIEDACESVGAKSDDKYSGTLGDIGVFSFDHGKNLTCGEGGMVLTSNQSISQYVASYSDHGHRFLQGVPRGSDTAVMPGFNYRMTELQAAVGKAQLLKLSRLCNLHKERYVILHEALQDHFCIRKPTTQLCIPSYDTFVITSLDPQLVKALTVKMSELRFGTKNLPDAMNWHCSFYWSHALGSDSAKENQSIYNMLSSSIAIPILASRPKEDYVKLAESICAV